VANLGQHGCLAASEQPRGFATLDGCGVAWDIAEAPDGNGYTIRRADTDNCLSMSALRIYPPRVWTDDCRGPWPNSWTVTETGESSVQISLTGNQSDCLTATEDGGPMLLVRCSGDPAQFWRLAPAA
jgi:hypothetical protein